MGLHVIRRPPLEQGPGNDHVLVAVHGAMDRSTSFRRLWTQLPDWHVVAYDRRGYAGSLDLPPAKDFDQQVRDLLGVVAGEVGPGAGGAGAGEAGANPTYDDRPNDDRRGAGEARRGAGRAGASRTYDDRPGADRPSAGTGASRTYDDQPNDDRRGAGGAGAGGTGASRTYDDRRSDDRPKVEWPPAERVVAFGHSYGGNVVLSAAVADPTALVAAVVYEPPAVWLEPWPDPAPRDLPPADQAEAFIRRVAGDRVWERLPEATRLLRRAEGDTLVSELAALRTGMPFAPEDVSIPVVVAYGGRGSARAAEWAAELAGRLPKGRLVEVPDADHGIHFGNPKALAELVRMAAGLAG